MIKINIWYGIVWALMIPANLLFADPDFNSKDPYRVLDLPETASTSEVKRAWKNLARQYHPDRIGSGHPDYEKYSNNMKSINAAYDALQKTTPSISSHGDLDIMDFVQGQIMGIQDPVERLKYIFQWGCPDDFDLSAEIFDNLTPEQFNSIKGDFKTLWGEIVMHRLIADAAVTLQLANSPDYIKRSGDFEKDMKRVSKTRALFHELYGDENSQKKFLGATIYTMMQSRTNFMALGTKYDYIERTKLLCIFLSHESDQAYFNMLADIMTSANKFAKNDPRYREVEVQAREGLDKMKGANPSLRRTTWSLVKEGFNYCRSIAGALMGQTKPELTKLN